MAKASEAYPWQLVLIEGRPIDCTKVETHNFESDVSEFPVESGSVISDNVRNRPVTVDLECIVSNTPVLNEDVAITEFDGTVTGGVKVDPKSPVVRQRSGTVYLHLVDIRDRREPITIRTSRGLFKNMVLKSLSIPRDASTGDAIMFRAVFQQITIVDNERNKRVAIPIAQGGGPKTKPPAKATADNKNVPVTVSIANRVTYIIKNGKRVNVWFDSLIGWWRETWFYELRPNDTGTLGSVGGVAPLVQRTAFVKGPMLDGFNGTDAQMVAHGNQAELVGSDKYLHIEQYEPWRRRKDGEAGSTTPHNMGRTLNIDGKPAVPDQTKAAFAGARASSVKK